MTFIKKLMIASIGFGGLTMAGIIAIPIHVHAGILSKIAKFFKAVGELLQTLDDIISGESVGKTTKIQLPLNIDELIKNGPTFGITLSDDHSSIIFSTETDFYESGLDPEKKLSIMKGTYSVNEQNEANILIVVRKK